MQNLQKFKITIQKGQVIKSEKIGKERPVSDSIADDLIIEGKKSISKDVISKIKGVKTIDIWKAGSKIKTAAADTE